MNLLTSRSRTTVLLFGAAAVAWVVTLRRMSGMDAGPGTDLGALGWYLGIWVTMSAAMMLPSAAPLVARVYRVLPTVFFVAGYLAAWTAFGVAAYGLFRLANSLEVGWVAWDLGGPYLAGGVILTAGLYELTPLKELLLRRCSRVDAGHNAVRTGLSNGLCCVGCCFGLIAVVFALGVMSIFWMAVVAGVIFAEKVWPQGFRVTRPVALALVALGIWVAVFPASVPMLTQPDRPPAMQMNP